MKKNSIFALFVALIGLLVPSCKQEQDLSREINKSSLDRTLGNKTFVLQERQVPIPQRVPKVNRFRSLSLDAPDLRKSPYNYLGAIHRVGNGILGHPMNIANDGIIDMNSLLNDKITSRLLYNRNLDITLISSQSYNKREAIEQHLLGSDKIQAGFNLDFKIFSLGTINTFYNIFQTSILSDKSNIWGITDFSYYAKTIGLETTEAGLKSIAARNIDPLFLYSIYFYPISDYIKEKGFLMVSKFFTGGKAIAYYNLQGKQDSINLITGNTTNNILNLSFIWDKEKDNSKKENKEKKNASSKDNILMIGFDDTSINSIEGIKKFKSIDCFVEVHGGSKLSFSGTPKNIYLQSDESIKHEFIKLGEWYSSLSNENEQQYIDIDKKGLISIDHFILEKNFQERFRKTLLGELEDIKESDIPYIQLANIPRELVFDKNDLFFNANDYYCETIGVTLHTRKGDNILFITNRLKQQFKDIPGSELRSTSDDEDEFINEFGDYEISYQKHEWLQQELKQSLSNIFKCKINGVYWKTRPFNEQKINNNKEVNMAVLFDYDSPNLFKYFNKKTNIWYICDDKNLTALSIYNGIDDEDEEYITSMYGITEWFKNIPTKRTSLSKITSNYTIIGL